ncbi:MAG: helix-turn-helix domain-containing protein [Chthoniobacter sp.]
MDQTSNPKPKADSIPDKKNYTLKEAAVYLNISTRTVERLIQRGLIRRNRALRKILIPRTELDRFLEKTL